MEILERVSLLLILNRLEGGLSGRTVWETLNALGLFSHQKNKLSNFRFSFFNDIIR